ncbi:TetR/AcrR family transcriptional regulator [Paenibacillus radicis (ex Gao et al. 2016)]|uniref:TetR family transcriptional regulator n=1 Tax=Paenibacillus radicis (ex Gao et al. 2016) TaxID=1737354 RepID=A0A917GYQ7_9BACL|nr:TetR/AcrR family transcriptional regulator [Paenibacillus radicis (ex Gao et al. 2016)]GGG60790.1 TetR family transcriptional regulator [Paenibacillus radicis (ex Gao et al. 2016)]
MAQQSKRSAILQVACKLVRERGASQLTLDAVAKEAGVSKGGLLYHFPTKEALVQAALDDFLNRFDSSTEEEASRNTKLNNQWAQAYLIQTFEINKEDLEMSFGILAAASSNPVLLEPMRQRYVEWQSRMAAECKDPVEATVARLAADGLFYCELFGFAPLEDGLRKDVLSYLLDMVKNRDVRSEGSPSNGAVQV